MRTVRERFEEKFEPVPFSGCWLWIGALDGKGYGAFTINGHQVRAHRFAFEQFSRPVPDGLTLDHLCRVRQCVNPAHLEPVTHRANVLRGVGSSAINARRIVCAHGHIFAGENVRLELGGRRRVCRACANLRNREREKRIRLTLGLPQPKAKRTFCRLGHAFTEENTYSYIHHGRIERVCRICQAQSVREYRERVRRAAFGSAVTPRERQATRP